MAQTIKEIERSLAEIDALLKAEGITLPTPCVSVEEGLQLACGLNATLRPFIAKYLHIVNGSRQHVEVNASKLHIYKAEAIKLSQTEEVLLSVMGTAYLRAIELITNGNELDIEDLLFELVTIIQLTANLDSTAQLLTVFERSNGTDLIAPVITKDEKEE